METHVGHIVICGVVASGLDNIVCFRMPPTQFFLPNYGYTSEFIKTKRLPGIELETSKAPKW